MRQAGHKPGQKGDQMLTWEEMKADKGRKLQSFCYRQCSRQGRPGYHPQVDGDDLHNDIVYPARRYRITRWLIEKVRDARNA
jgi:hypothetical protein